MSIKKNKTFFQAFLVLTLTVDLELAFIYKKPFELSIWQVLEVSLCIGLISNSFASQIMGEGQKSVK